MLIQTKHLSKKYKDTYVVKDLNLKIEEGQLLAYIGTNGAGKSTTISMLVGLLKQTEGRIICQDNLKIGIVFQNSVLDHDLTVADNLKIRAALYKLEDKKWLSNLFDLLDLSADILKKQYGHLSGGQKRKVDIVRALLHKPQLLFLDEPTTGLDIQTRQKIWQVLHYLSGKEGMTIFLTTHYLEEAENADWTYIIDKGRILAQGSASDLKESFASNSLILTLKEGRDIVALADKKQENGQLLLSPVSLSDVILTLQTYADAISDFDYIKGDMNQVFISVVGREMENESLD